MQFLAVVHKDQDSAYGVSFPDLPGCFSASDAEADITANAIEALELYFEDAEIVEPSALQDVMEREKEDLADGAALMWVPYVPRPTRQVRANISMDAGMLKAIDDEAKRLGLTRSGYISQATRNEIGASSRGSHFVKRGAKTGRVGGGKVADKETRQRA